jgi:1-acyl-sn-glycerol-3-phosphate acyltransferase
MFITADLVERTVIVALLRLRPASRQRILRVWLRSLTRLGLWIIRGVGGARITNLPSVPAEEGVLVVMNHQSLVDIPVVFEFVKGGYPRIVTRKRYFSGIPLVSHMLRLYGHLPVEPGRNATPQVTSLGETAATTSLPIAIFPEGQRTRDGNIRPFRTAGLKAILSARRWAVYVVVADGLCPAARLGGYIRHVSAIDARVESMGPLVFDGSSDDIDAFIEGLRRMMCDKLDEMRAAQQSPADKPDGTATRKDHAR